MTMHSLDDRNLAAVKEDGSSGKTMTKDKGKVPETLEELLHLPEDKLLDVDLAIVNLLCAKDLKGAEDLNIDKCSAILDKWAVHIKFETDRHIYKFRQSPREYENSEGFFRMLVLNTVIQQDFAVHYNLERIRNVDFGNSKDLFIHGMINDANGGTCSSMPVLVAAVARRLGYPVRLSTTKAHVFCRWEAPGDRINLEPSGNGLNTYSDDHYKKWPIESSEEEINANRYLVSLSPKEELALCLETRGYCLMDNKRFGEAEEVFSQTLTLCPGLYRIKAFLSEAHNKKIASGKNAPIKGSSTQQEKRYSAPQDGWNVRDYLKRNQRYSPEAPNSNAIGHSVAAYKSSSPQQLSPGNSEHQHLP